MTEEMKWNPRYVQFARAHGREPEEQLRADFDRWPGGRMTGFQLWMMERWERWRFERGYHRDHILSEIDQVDFDRWLVSWVDKALEAPRRFGDAVQAERREARPAGDGG